MTEDQKIYRKIGEILWSIMPESAQEMYLIGKIYPDTYELCLEWLQKDLSIGRFGFDNYPHKVCEDIYELACKLQKQAPFEREVWTHFKVILTESGKIKVEFCYIPQDDSWPGLLMNRVSELTLEEAKKYYIPEDEWIKCIEKYKGK
ncbi:immunity protein YezG family protein [Photobacterium salinisoli]|uniref:immunity protein YezG family protein n=1 Tax=Photobacterium salinisoli TaxID=1616783 RepID=UPI000EA30687|nr:immunity protein YezG family protein [Photobacterium salinisoli]